MKPSATSNRRTQNGLSLIETMVGITVGLMVVLASVGTLVVTRQSATAVSDSARLTNAGNMALRNIAFTIRQAGAAELVQTDGQGTPVMFGDLTQRGTAGDQIVGGTEGGAGPDTLIVRYEHRNDNITRDCLGNSPGVALPERIDNTYAVTQVELRCTGTRGSNASNIAPPQALVGDNSRATLDIAVEDFQVWYWIRNAAGQQQRVTATAAAAAVPNGWAAVDAVEICLQLRGTRTDFPAGNFNNCRGVATANGGRLHQLFRGTYKLRNLVG